MVNYENLEFGMKFMSSDKKKNKLREVPESFVLENQIKSIVTGLYYMSETDAEVLPFVGAAAEAVSAEEILRQTGNEADTKIEQREFEDFFSRLTKNEDWFGEEEKATAAKYAELKKLLEGNLRDLKVFKIGNIQIDIYAVGLPAENILSGIKTKAVET